MAYDFYFLHPLAAESASAQINIIVKPRDSNNVLPEENTNEFSIPAHNGWQPDYEKNLIKSQDNNRVYGHVVKHGQDDYSYGAVTPNSWSDDKRHMRFNEVSNSNEYWGNYPLDVTQFLNMYKVINMYMVVFTLRPKLVFAKVEFSTGYTKTHSLSSQILPFRSKTIA